MEMHERKINLRGETIGYQLRVSKKAKRIRLNIYDGGRFIVTVPQRVKLTFAEAFILEKANWVINSIKYYQQFQPISYERNDPLFLSCEDAARELVLAAIKKYNAHYEVDFNKVTIKNLRSMWASCTRYGNLNFHYKLLFLSPSVAEYVVVHELCHLKEFNHSKRFWARVAETMPDYAALRKELKNSPR